MLNDDGQAAVMVYEIHMFCELHVWAILKLQLGGWWGAGGEGGGGQNRGICWCQSDGHSGVRVPSYSTFSNRGQAMEEKLKPLCNFSLSRKMQ